MVVQTFKKKYRKNAQRLRYWNYANPGYYFVTICTIHRRKYLGHVLNQKMALSDIGEVAKKCWLSIPAHFKNATLDAMVVMPDHVHGIVVINSPSNTTASSSLVPLRERTGVRWEKRLFAKPVKQSLSMIINHYKGAVKRFCNREHQVFGWNPRFHDYIIESERTLQQIRQYILENPLHWQGSKAACHGMPPLA